MATINCPTKRQPRPKPIYIFSEPEKQIVKKKKKALTEHDCYIINSFHNKQNMQIKGY